MKKAITALLCITMISSFFPITSSASNVSHKVVSGESLWIISQKYNVPVDTIISLNGLKSNNINVGQNLLIRETPAVNSNYIDYIVKKGETLGGIAERFGTRVDSINNLNGFISDYLLEGQKIKVPADYTAYTVKSGDTLFLIAKKYNVTIEDIKLFSGITNDSLNIGQLLKIPSRASAKTTPQPTAPPSTSATKPTITYQNYAVASGDTAWKISIKFGIPMTELLQANNLKIDTVLRLGQILRIPIHSIPVKSVNGPEYGEYLDWWTEAQYVFPIEKIATVTDFYTKKTFRIKRTVGANHADNEPLTSLDTSIAKQIWGGRFSWSTRPVIVECDGRRIAASMSFYPHDVEYIMNNNFDGHFDIHFLNSTRHKDGAIDWDHQAKIKIAAGVK